MIKDKEINSVTESLIRENFYKYFSKKKPKTKHIILDRFFSDERRITSTMSGLQTSLGSFWEALAKTLAPLNKFEVKENSQLEMPKNMPTELRSLIDEAKNTRERYQGELDDLKNKLNDLYKDPIKKDIEFQPITKGKGSDLILSKKDKIHIFDIKTVQVNANNGNTFNETLISWTAYLKYKYRIDANNIDAKLVFPYNSSDEDNDSSWWNDFGDRISPLSKNDVFVGNQFWSFITGNENALSSIITAFDTVSNDKSFIDMYSQAFKLKSEDELTQFIQDIKIFRVKETRNIDLHGENPIIDSRRKLNWKHDNCKFKERINKLLKSGDYICPTCDSVIKN